MNDTRKITTGLMFLRLNGEDIAAASFAQLVGMIVQHDIADGISPERMAAAMMVLIKNGDDWRE